MKKLLLFLMALLLISCSRNNSFFEVEPPDNTESKVNPFVGTWITDCLDMGGGAVNKIYSRVNSQLESMQAVLTFSGASCTGTYTLSDTQGNPITEPTHEFDANFEVVSGMPKNFYIIKVTNISDSSFIYVVMNFGVSQFHELVAFAGTHATWADWLLEPDVAGFVADPINYVPSGGGMVLHFNSTDGLP